MSDTLIIQSHRSPLPYPWLSRCIDSVRDWASANDFAYRFLGDELFDRVPGEIMRKNAGQRVIATDLARLYVLQDALGEGYKTVVWLDAGFLIFEPRGFILPGASHSVGREVWIQQDKQGSLKAYKKVHNAFLLFRQGNSFLDFYTETAERLLTLNTGSMPPQFIGPKLLTALHNIVQLPVMEQAGMLSPMVIRDLNRAQGPALELFLAQSPATVSGANLCGSSRERDELTDAEMLRSIETLLRGASIDVLADGKSAR